MKVISFLVILCLTFNNIYSKGFYDKKNKPKENKQIIQPPPKPTLERKGPEPQIVHINLINSSDSTHHHLLNLTEEVIDKEHNLKSLSGLMMRTHIVSESTDLLKGQTHNCAEPNCETCSEHMTNVCIKCKHGTFLYNNLCGNVCPQNYVADIYWRICKPLTEFSNFLL